VVSLEGTPWRWIATVVGIVLLANFVYGTLVALLFVLRDLLLWIVTALFLSFALEPAVSWAAARGWKRSRVTLALLLGLFLGGLALVVLMVPVFVTQLQELVKATPEIVNDVGDFTDRYLGIQLSADSLQTTFTDLSSRLTSYASNAAGAIFGAGAALLRAIFGVLTISLFCYYMVADGPRFRRALLSFVPPARQERVLWTWEVAIDKTGGYLYSRLLLALVSGAVTFLVLRILSVPFALPLAVWMGLVSQFIPTVGTYIAMALPLLVAVVKSPIDALILLVFFVAYQQVENYLLAPRITSKTMSMHPALAFGAAIAGATLGGLIGAFLAIPAAAILQAVLSTVRTRHDVLETHLTRDHPVGESEVDPPPGGSAEEAAPED
jgi:predicted PurR-regulated permease PerM